MTLYRAYQLVGGNEPWVSAHDNTDFKAIGPTFITVLACDTLLTKTSLKNMVEDAKYYGPMYFDLDDEHEVGNAIAGAKELWAKLESYGLTEQDVDIFLSGKKGLHLLVSPICFMEKQAPVHKLPSIYKEIAFRLAVDRLDFSIYSLRRGRMLRTTYQKRDNGNYKVAITAQQLRELTAESYNTLCAVPKDAEPKKPTFKPKFAILYEEIGQKLRATKKIKTKPVDAVTLKRHLPTIERLMKGEGVKEGTGFNKIAIQLAIYAHEAKLTEDELVAQCEGLAVNHSSDGYRYNSYSKRKEELRRMYTYLEDNSGYDYAIGPIKAMLEVKEDATEGEEASDEGDGSGLFVRNNSYLVASEQGDRHIMDAKFTEAAVLLFPETGEIACIYAKIQTNEKTGKIVLERGDFASSSALHKVVSTHGVSFTGTDIHARHLYTHMLREAKIDGLTVYVTGREGLDMLQVPMSSIEEAREPFVVWSDSNGVIIPKSLVEKGLDIRFIGYPDEKGVLKTDLAKAPNWLQWSALPDHTDKMFTMLKGLLTCQSPSSISKLIGWMTSCFYGALFRNSYGKFPLLHINGVAGSGKTETLEGLMHMFYYRADPLIMSPSSSNFALSSAVSASASIPVIIDEYKPHKMHPNRLEELKSMFRSSYNTHTVSKGGGNRVKDSFGAIHSVKLSGPIVFVAEAMEQETALLERCVLVTLRRPSGLMYKRYAPRFQDFKKNQGLLAILGQHIAATVISGYSTAMLIQEFDVLHEAARKQHMENGQLTLSAQESEKAPPKEEFYSRPRVVYNHAIAEFGLTKFFEVILKMFPTKAEELSTIFKALLDGVYQGMDEVAKQTMPEYIKVLMVLSDMSRFRSDDSNKLNSGIDYELGSIADTSTLTLVGRLCFNRYRTYCKTIGELPLFSGEASFLHALRDSDLFIRTGTGTKQVQQETLVLDYEALQRLKMPPFSGN